MPKKCRQLFNVPILNAQNTSVCCDGGDSSVSFGLEGFDQVQADCVLCIDIFFDKIISSLHNDLNDIIAGDFNYNLFNLLNLNDVDSFLNGMFPIW